MQKNTSAIQSGVSLAVRPRSSPAEEAAKSPAERIRHVEELLRDLLLENDFDPEHSFLCGDVSDNLEQIQLRLSDVAGKQELFELWIR